MIKNMDSQDGGTAPIGGFSTHPFELMSSLVLARAFVYTMVGKVEVEESEVQPP